MAASDGGVMLVTGSSTGIGAATAILAAQNGYRLSITARNETNLEIVKQECLKIGLKEEQVLVTPGCLTQSEFRKSLVENTIKRFGQLDVLVNNAGILVGKDMMDLEMVDYDNVMDLNLRAAVDMSKLCMPYLIATKGNIINVSSICGLNTVCKGFTFYCMTKAALNMFTKCLALELAPKGVRVNAVNPAFTRTPIFNVDNTGVENAQTEQFYECLGVQHPIGRVAVPLEMAEMIIFLASDKASFVTGTPHYVDGGLMVGAPQGAPGIKQK